MIDKKTKKKDLEGPIDPDIPLNPEDSKKAKKPPVQKKPAQTKPVESKFNTRDLLDIPIEIETQIEEEEKEPVLQEEDVEQVARDAQDPESASLSVRDGFDSKTLEVPRSKRQEHCDSDVPETKQGKVKRAFNQFDQIFTVTQNFETTFVWAMHNKLISVVPQCTRCKVPYKLIKHNEYIYDSRCYKCSVCDTI